MFDLMFKRSIDGKGACGTRVLGRYIKEFNTDP
jgi:hypothetical protein